MSKDLYYMKIAKVISEKSTCLRHHFGAVITKDDVIVSTGYNGAPRKCKHCTELGCLRNELNIPSGTKIETCRAVHAEMNAIIQADGYKMIDSNIYINGIPCITCAKMIINARIKRVVCIDNNYPDIQGLKLLDNMIEVVKC